MGLDLSTLEPRDTSVLKVVHPVTHETTDIDVELYGIDSKQYQKSYRKIVDRRLKQMKKKTARTDDGVELLADCTAGWSGVELDGKPLEFSRQNALMLYRKFAWLKEQVDYFIGDRANFINA